MIGIGLLAALIALIALWTVSRGRMPGAVTTRLSPFWSKVLLWSMLALPFLALTSNTLGWIFTEMARQPWLVFGRVKTSAGVSPNPAGDVFTWLVLILLYGGLGVVTGGLMVKYARAELPDRELTSRRRL
jgi:cytochrome d ubiquinol oxidase subunit I